jgi:hypothetical protein
MEPFWDLKISRYVEYVMHVSSEYLIIKLRATLSDKYGWLNFLAYVIPYM